MEDYHYIPEEHTLPNSASWSEYWWGTDNFREELKAEKEAVGSLIQTWLVMIEEAKDIDCQLRNAQ